MWSASKDASTARCSMRRFARRPITARTLEKCRLNPSSVSSGKNHSACLRPILRGSPLLASACSRDHTRMSGITSGSCSS